MLHVWAPILPAFSSAPSVTGQVPNDAPIYRPDPARAVCYTRSCARAVR